MLESEITRRILSFLKSIPHCFAWKQQGGIYGTSGLPDIICCYHGRFVAFEVKTPNGKLTKLQDTTLRRIRDAKGEAFKVQSLEEAKLILKRIKLEQEVSP